MNSFQLPRWAYDGSCEVFNNWLVNSDQQGRPLQALYFGQSGRQLLGVYYEPDNYTSNSTKSVLLCSPIGHEYMSTHWAIRRLSASLADAGFHVFKFDYFGTGDSAGEFGEGSTAQWTSDIQMAATELLDISGNRNILLLGLRFGATLAALAARNIKPNGLVLWDPVMDGESYIQELREIHRVKAATYSVWKYNLGYQTTEHTELMGFPFTPALLESLTDVKLTDSLSDAELDVSLVLSIESEGHQRLNEILTQQDRLKHYYRMEDGGDWLQRLAGQEQVLVSNTLLATLKHMVVEHS